jgi:predicted P-loop ATPase
MSLLYGKDRLSCPISKVKGVNSSKILDVVTLGDVFKEIRTDDLPQIKAAEQLHAAYKSAPPQYDALKVQLPAFIVGKFTKREDSACEISVPLCIFDVDKIGDDLFTIWMLDELRRNPYVFFAFPSPSGQGLRVGVWCNIAPDNRKQVYEAFCQYLADWLNIETDKQMRKRLKSEGVTDDGKAPRIDTGTSNISRLWFYNAISANEFYLNLESQVFRLEEEPQNVQQAYLAEKLPILPTMSEAEKMDALIQVVQNRNLSTGRNNLIFTLACCFNEHGIGQDAILSRCLTYTEKDFTDAEIRRTVESALKRTQPKYTDLQLQKYLKSDEKTLKPLPKIQKGDPSVSDTFSPNSGDDFKPNKFLGIKNFIARKYDLRRNIVAMEIEASPKEANTFEVLNDNDLICDLLEQGYKGVADTVTALIRSSRVPSYDPFKDYFSALAHWNSSMPDYIETLANFVKAKDQAWFNYQLKKALVRTVACALLRIPFNKQCFTILGKQNDGKTSFIRFLCPPALKNYFKEDLDIQNKDGRLALVQNFIINFDELSTFSKYDINRIKTFFTIDKIKERMPYDRTPMSFRRRTSFFASTNKNDFLTDETGNVRWLIMEIDGVQHDNGGTEGYEKKVDINLVWAQAYALLQSGFEFYLTSDDILKSETNNTRFSKATYEEELLMQFFTPSVKGEPDAQFLTVTNIRDEIEGSADKGRKLIHENIGRALVKLKFEQGSQYDTKTKYTKKGYWLKRI